MRGKIFLSWNKNRALFLKMKNIQRRKNCYLKLKIWWLILNLIVEVIFQKVGQKGERKWTYRRTHQIRIEMIKNGENNREKIISEWLSRVDGLEFLYWKAHRVRGTVSVIRGTFKDIIRNFKTLVQKKKPQQNKQTKKNLKFSREEGKIITH